MKSFLIILASAALAFIAGAMLQEWETFAGPWFSPPPSSPVLSDDDRDGATSAVFLYLKVSSHLYGTSGDPRFAERIPASPMLLDELNAEIRYLQHAGLVEDPLLQRMEVLSVEASSEDHVEVVTKEYWITRRYRRGESTPLETRSDILHNRYRVLKEDSTWRVISWDPTQPPPPEEAGS